MLSISLTVPNHTATQMTTGLLISSTASRLSWFTICWQQESNRRNSTFCMYKCSESNNMNWSCQSYLMLVILLNKCTARNSDKIVSARNSIYCWAQTVTCQTEISTKVKMILIEIYRKTTQTYVGSPPQSKTNSDAMISLSHYYHITWIPKPHK